MSHGSLLPRSGSYCERIYSYINSCVACVTFSCARRFHAIRSWNSSYIFYDHTQIDTSHIEYYNYKFRNLTVDSRLEIAFAGRPKNFRVPNYKIYKHEHSEGLSVVFDVETRLIKRYIPSNCDFDILEIERTDYLLLPGCTQRQIADMMSYMNI